MPLHENRGTVAGHRQKQAYAEEGRIDHLFATVPDFIFRLDRAGTILECHAAHLSPRQDQPDAFLGRHLPDVLPMAIADLVATALAEMRETHDATDVQCALPQAGESRVMEARLMPLISGEIVAVVRTIAQRQPRGQQLPQADNAFETPRRELEVLIESIADAAFVCDEAGHIKLVNNAGLALIGEQRERQLRTLADYLDALQLHDADGRSINVDNMGITRALRGEVVRGHEEEGIRPRSSDRINLLVSAAPLHAADGHIVGAIEIATDVTPLKTLAGIAQRKAAESEAIIDNMVDGVFVCDADRRFIVVNRAGLDLTGFADIQEMNENLEHMAKAAGMRHVDGRLFEPQDLAFYRALGGHVVADQDQIIRNRRTGRDVHMRVSASPIHDSRGHIVGAVAVGRDVTELMALDSLKDQFISVAAHELKTPVAIMKGYAQALLRTAEDLSSPRQRMLDAINRGSDRIDNIVMDLLDISRLQGGRLELANSRVDLPELVAEVVDRFALTAPKHRVRLLSAEPVVVEADRDRLEQVLVNLLDNSVRYSPKGGDVDVTVLVRQGDAAVAVRDTGVGIPAAKQGNVFQRFYRAHTGTPFDYGGMGVGLYICREIIKRHGGDMWFESEEGRGSTFYFSLPLRS